MRSKSSSSRGTPTRPASARRWITAFVEPPTADRTRMAFSNAGRVSTLLGRRSCRDHLDRAATGQVGETAATIVGCRDRRAVRERHAERLGHRCHRRGRPHRVAVAGAPDHRGLRRDEILHAHQAGAHLFAHPPHVGRGAERTPAMTPGQHRPAGQHDRGKIHGRCPHEHRRRRLVAPRQQHDTVEGVAAQRLLDVHGHEVSQEHRRRLDLGLAERRHGELERDATCLPDAPLDVVGQVVQVLVARSELGRGVADADHRLAGERVVWQATLHPAAMEVVVARRAAVPAGGP